MSPICQEFLCSPYDISCNLHNHLIKYGYFHLTDEKPNIKAVQKVSKGHIYKYLVQFNSVMSDLLRPQGLHHTRPPRPTPIPRVYSDSCPLSWWCHSTISPSVIPFSSCLQPFPASGSFPMGQFFASGGQSIEVSASASVLPVIFRTDFLEDWLVGSPCSPRDSQASSPSPQFKSINSSALSFLYSPTLTSIDDY